MTKTVATTAPQLRSHKPKVQAQRSSTGADAGMPLVINQMGNGAIQRLLAQRSGDGAFDLDDATAGRINRARGGGQALDTSIQAKMGESMGADFSGVRVHTGSESHALNEQLNAKAIQKSILTFCKRAHYPFAILDAPPINDVQTMNEWRMDLSYGDTPHGALYFPWIKIADPFNAGQQIAIPPSGHMAGIYARSDSQRGVHKAPANETISGALDLTVNVTKAEQELLNPNGVNCIRKFPGRGIRVWGARTLAMTDPSWRYINVRRLFSYVEASVERNTQWVVFEPNDFMLWAKVRRDVTAFLRTVWLSGALFGVTPEQAFYVKCDEETNPTELRDLGQMVCEIGMAPVKPAEFVIFRFSQWAGQDA